MRSNDVTANVTANDTYRVSKLTVVETKANAAKGWACEP